MGWLEFHFEQLHHNFSVPNDIRVSIPLNFDLMVDIPDHHTAASVMFCMPSWGVTSVLNGQAMGVSSKLTPSR